MKKFKFLLTILLLCFFQLDVYAFHSLGEIDSDLIYENLKFEKEYEREYLLGTIINRGVEHRKDIRVRFDAYDVFNKIIWQTTVRIDFLKSNGKHNFKQSILSQKAEAPLNIKIVNLGKLEKENAKSRNVTVDDHLYTSSNRLPVYINGNGRKMSDLFELDRGLIKATFNHTGKGHFSISLKDQNGKNIELLVNEIGKVDGSASASIAKFGKYFVDVKADPDANWSVTLEKPNTESYYMTKDQDKIQIKKGKDGVTYLELND